MASPGPEAPTAGGGDFGPIGDVRKLEVQLDGLKKLSAKSLDPYLHNIKSIQRAESLFPQLSALLSQLQTDASLQCSRIALDSGEEDHIMVRLRLQEEKMSYSASVTMGTQGQVVSEAKHFRPYLRGTLAHLTVSSQWSSLSNCTHHLSVGHPALVRWPWPWARQPQPAAGTSGSCPATLRFDREALDFSATSSFTAVCQGVRASLKSPPPLGGPLGEDWRHTLAAEATMREVTANVQEPLRASEAVRLEAGGCSKVGVSCHSNFSSVDYAADGQPESGSNVDGRMELALPLLPGDVSFAKASASWTGFFSCTLRKSGSGSVSHPGAPAAFLERLTASVDVGAGALVTPAGQKSSVLDRFFLGGSTVDRMRGFQRRTVSPSVQCPASTPPAAGASASDSSSSPTDASSHVPERWDALGGEAYVRAGSSLAVSLGSGLRGFGFAEAAAVLPSARGAKIEQVRQETRTAVGIGLSAAIAMGTTLEVTLTHPVAVQAHDRTQRFAIGLSVASTD